MFDGNLDKCLEGQRLKYKGKPLLMILFFAVLFCWHPLIVADKVILFTDECHLR